LLGSGVVSSKPTESNCYRFVKAREGRFAKQLFIGEGVNVNATIVASVDLGAAASKLDNQELSRIASRYRGSIYLASEISSDRLKLASVCVGIQGHAA